MQGAVERAPIRGEPMNQSTVSADPVLKMFDEDISQVLSEISAWLGIGAISLQMEPSLVRHRAAVTCTYSFTNEFYTTIHKGKFEYKGAPALKRAYVNDHVKA